MESTYSDPRILDFRKEHIELPNKFSFIHVRNMMLACGDGMKGDTLCDIEFYTQRVEVKINIFCCSYDYNDIELGKNIQYLMEHPELNIVLCLFNLEHREQVGKLIKLFSDSIDNLGTDDARFYIPARVTYEIMKIDGNIHSVDIRVKETKTEFPIDPEYGNPELFIETDIDLENYTGTYRFRIPYKSGIPRILHRTPNRRELRLMSRGEGDAASADVRETITHSIIKYQNEIKKDVNMKKYILYGGNEAPHPSLDKDAKHLYLKYKKKYLNLKKLI